LKEDIVFGPVPSRRLGLSLGINNVYSKYCSYSCIYCQVGRTDHLVIKRRKFYEPLKLAKKVIKEVKRKNPEVITFAPNGEPTLDVNLGVEIELLKRDISKPIAILTNSSLLPREDVYSDLMLFDIISLKLDTVDKNTWKKINRPHPKLDLRDILNSIEDFAKEYRGKLLFETMIVENVNNNTREYRGIARFLSKLRFYKAYIQSPIRPPTEKWVKPASEEDYLKAYQVFVEELGRDKVELLISPEPSSFIFSDNLVYEITKTIYVHPIRINQLKDIVEERGIDLDSVLNELVGKGIAKIIDYNREKFLVPKTRK